MLAPALIGFSSGLGLILAIGSQNAFVLRQGLMQRHVLPLVVFCGASDAILIGAGVLGFDAIVARVPFFRPLMLWLGVAFLSAYGVNRLWAAWQGGGAMAAGQSRTTLGGVLALAAAFTWLNPHVYLDTMALMGAISVEYKTASEKFAFFLGGSLASFTFFAALGFGASRLRPLFTSARAWRVLDLLIAITMFAIAIKLTLEAMKLTEP